MELPLSFPTPFSSSRPQQLSVYIEVYLVRESPNKLDFVDGNDWVLTPGKYEKLPTRL